jgi:uncharacterized protein
MKFQPESSEGFNVITRQEAGCIWVGASPHTRGVLVPWQGEVLDWQAGEADALSLAHFERIAALRPELVIFGSGARLRFPDPALLRPLMALRIGVETMDTAAACRTYNVLVSERRMALAALLPAVAG